MIIEGTDIGIPEDYSIYKTGKKEKCIFIICSGLLLFIAAYIFYGSLHIAILFSPAAAFLIKPYEGYRIEKRKKALSQQFKDALYSMSASIAAGRSLTNAICEAAVHTRLIYGANALIVMELELMTKRFNESREYEEQVLTDFAGRSKIKEISGFVGVLLTCRETGGDLEKVILKTAGIIMEKMTVRQEIQVLTAQKKLEGRLLAAFPFLVVGSLRLISPDYLEILDHTIAGRIIVTISMIMTIVAIVLIRKITEIEI